MRAQRFVPGSFQRSAVEIDEEISGQLEYIEFWKKRHEAAKEKLEEMMRGEGLPEDDEETEGDEEEKFANLIAEQEDKVVDTANMVRASLEELQELEKLRKGIKTQPDRLPLMLTMINTNFAETYADYVCSSSYTDIVFDIEFSESAEEGSIAHTYNVGEFQCSRRDRPIFLKIEKPGHMLCALIFPDAKKCELWNTAKVDKDIQKYFVALLPRNYTIECINAQLQVKYCIKGAVENVYIVKQQPGVKALINVYCQTWPYFFAYMRCVKKFSAKDVIKFLSCLTDRQKTILIDAFNTALANRGEDVRYISEINNRAHFKEYVQGCDPLLRLEKSIKTVSAKDYDDYRKIARELNEDEFAVALRSLLKK